MIDQPHVTVNILSFNRKDELRNTLMKVYEQDYKNIEVIVVDNASTDGSREMVNEEFPSVNLIRLNKNIGIAGWNEGFKAAKGDYILVLDDDAYPHDESIKKAVSRFQSDDRIACITFNLISSNIKNTKRTKWLPLVSVTECEWPIFVGCAAMFRNLGDIIYMPEDYFLYQHELPVAANIYNSGYKIMYYSDIMASHFFKYSDSYNSFNDQLQLVNNIRFIRYYIPLFMVPFYYTQQVLFFFTRSIKYGWFKSFFKCLPVLRSKEKRKFKNRRIDLNYFLELRRLHIFNYPLLSKIIKTSKEK